MHGYKDEDKKAKAIFKKAFTKYSFDKNDKAVKLFNNALKYTENYKARAVITAMIGKIAFEKYNFHAAEDMLKKALSYSKDLENMNEKQIQYQIELCLNWFSKDGIGEYISAIANGAALCGKEFGYVVWGINDKTKEITGTTINFDKDIDGEPYKHYLARKLTPSIPFEVKEFLYNDKRIVILTIPSSMR